MHELVQFQLLHTLIQIVPAHVVVCEMARLSASTLQVSGDCVDVNEGERDGEALLTLVRAIEVHNVSHNYLAVKYVVTILSFAYGCQLYDHRCVHSWPLSSTDHVTCPAHFHKAMEKYCAVRNGTVRSSVVCVYVLQGITL